MEIALGFLGVVLGIIFILVIAYIYLVHKLKSFGFQGNSLSELKEEITDIADTVPKQVSGMTSIFLPQILNDFKDFNLNELYLLVEKSIRETLNAIENKNLSILHDKDFNLINKKFKFQLEDLINSDILYTYDDIVFHKHALKNYSNKNGIATIEVSSSLEYYYSKKVNGKVVEKKNKKKQARYITKFVYIVDNDAYKKDINVYGLNCPNCGAVIQSLGSKKCSYCKTGLNIQVVDLLKCWKLIECKEN